MTAYALTLFALLGIPFGFDCGELPVGAHQEDCSAIEISSEGEDDADADTSSSHDYRPGGQGVSRTGYSTDISNGF